MKWKYSDFDKGPELSPDLEWMVQSGQVSRQVFAETLVKTYYAPIYRLALSLLNDLSAAQTACREVFSRAILSTHQYRSQVGIDAWIKQIAYQTIKTALRRERFWRGVEKLAGGRGQFTDKLSDHPPTEVDRLIWHQVDGLDDTERIPFVLYFANGWQLEQIASTLEIPPQQVQQRLQHALAGFANLGEDPPPDLESWVRSSLVRRWSLPVMDEEDIQRFLIKIQRHTGQRSILRNRAATTREVVLLGIALVIVILAIWGGNRYLLQSEAGASSAGSYLDAGGLGILQNLMASSMSLVSSGQAAGEDRSEAVREEAPSMPMNDATEASLRSNSERCRSQDLLALSEGRYSAFKNKDRIRRFRLSQPPENTTILQGEPSTGSVLIPPSLEPLEAR